jgi:hypothetical protein
LTFWTRRSKIVGAGDFTDVINQLWDAIGTHAMVEQLQAFTTLGFTDST